MYYFSTEKNIKEFMFIIQKIVLFKNTRKQFLQSFICFFNIKKIICIFKTGLINKYTRYDTSPVFFIAL